MYCILVVVAAVVAVEVVDCKLIVLVLGRVHYCMYFVVDFVVTVAVENCKLLVLSSYMCY